MTIFDELSIYRMREKYARYINADGVAYTLYPVKEGDPILPGATGEYGELTFPADGMKLTFVGSGKCREFKKLHDEDGRLITPEGEDDATIAARFVEMLDYSNARISFLHFYLSDDERHTSILHTSLNLFSSRPHELERSRSRPFLTARPDASLIEKAERSWTFGLPMLSVSEDREDMSTEGPGGNTLFLPIFLDIALPALFRCNREEACGKYAASRFPELTRFHPRIFEGNDLGRWLLFNPRFVQKWIRYDAPSYTSYLTRALNETGLVKGPHRTTPLKPRKDYVKRIARLFNEGDGKAAYNALIRSIVLINAIRESDAPSGWEDRMIQALNPESLRPARDFWRDYTGNSRDVAFLLGFLGKDFHRFLDDYLYETSNLNLASLASLINPLGHHQPTDPEGNYQLGEAVRQENAEFLSSPEFARCTDFDTLHDILFAYQRREMEDRLHQMNVPETPLSHRVQSAPAVEQDGHTYTFQYPETALEINKWSYYLDNCMTSYAVRVHYGQYAIVLVKQDDKPYAALGLQAKKGPGRTYVKDQFYRAKNRKLDPHLERNLLKAILG